MNDRMDTATEQRMLNCVRQMAMQVREHGLDPTNALVKVAQANHLTPPQIRRVGEAYNVSRSIANHKMASGEARTENFPVAFPDQAMTLVYPEHYKTASQALVGREMLKVAQVESVIGLPNLLEKAASTLNTIELPIETAVPNYPRLNTGVNDWLSTKGNHEKQARDLSTAYATAKIEFQRQLEKMADVTVRALDSGLAFDRIEIGLANRYGQETGVKLASVLYTLVHGEERHLKRASVFRTTLQDYSLTPFNTIDLFVKAALDVETKGKALSRLQEAAPESPFTVAAPAANQVYHSADEILMGKQADFMPNTMSTVNRAISALDVSPEPAYQQALAKAMNRVEDPATRDAIRKTKVQSMLTDLFANDDVIKAHPDREEVLDYYNELAQLAPDVADQPMMVRGILRRAVQQGYLDPFEAGQFISNNSALKQNQKVDGDRSLMKAMSTDVNSLRPDLNRTGGKFNPTGLLTGGKGSLQTRSGFADPNLNMQAAGLNLQGQQLAHQKNQLGQDKDKFNAQMQLQTNTANRASATANVDAAGTPTGGSKTTFIDPKTGTPLDPLTAPSI